MPKAHQTWTVLPHGEIREVTENIWTVEGTLPGPPMPRTMTLVRLSDGRLIIHSAVALEAPAMKKVEGWGKPAFLLVPGVGHRLDAKIYKLRYPELVVLCPPGARKNVEAVLAVDWTEMDFGDPNVTWTTLAGTGGHESALIVHSASGTTLILNDVMMNMRSLPGIKGFMAGLFGFVGPAKLPRIPKMLLVKEKPAFRAQLEKLAETADLQRIIVGHGDPVEPGAAAALRRLAATV